MKKSTNLEKPTLEWTSETNEHLTAIQRSLRQTWANDPPAMINIYAREIHFFHPVINELNSECFVGQPALFANVEHLSISNEISHMFFVQNIQQLDQNCLIYAYNSFDCKAKQISIGFLTIDPSKRNLFSRQKIFLTSTVDLDLIINKLILPIELFDPKSTELLQIHIKFRKLACKVSIEQAKLMVIISCDIHFILTPFKNFYTDFFRVSFCKESSTSKFRFAAVHNSNSDKRIIFRTL